MLDKIFSIKSYNETHNLFICFGIKIKYPKPSIRKILKQQKYYKYIRENAEITALPPAEGHIRDIQLANLALLKEMDYVCKQNNLTYWLDFGSLLGAVRHKGFIPWDDDIDLGMPRCDYNKLAEVFSKTSRNPEIFVEYCQCYNKPCQLILKIKHKKCSKIFVDIFPYDELGNALSEKEQIEQTKKIKKVRRNLEKINKNISSNDEILKILEEHRYGINEQKEIILNYVWGIDYNHHWQNWFVERDVIYPLKNIEFEQNTFPCFYNSDKYLTRVYGNYMRYPKKIGYGHSMFTKLTDEEKDVIINLRKQEVFL